MQILTKQRLDFHLGMWLIGLLKPLAVVLGWVLRRDHTCVPRGAIAVFKMQGGGSLVLAAPALHGLRVRYPEQPLLLVTTRAVRPFGEMLQLFDEIVCLDDRNLFRLVGSAFLALWRLRGTDTILDLEVYSRLTGVLALCTTARNRIGFFLDHTFWRRGIYTHLVYFNRHHTVTFFYERMVRLLGAIELAREETARRMGMARTVEVEEQIDRPVMIIGAGCSDMAIERRMPPAGWVHFLGPVIGENPKAEFIWLGNANDRPVAEAIIEALRARVGPARYHNACGTLPLRASVELLRGATGFFGIDSALLHFSRLAGIPSTSFWGPVSPIQRLTPWPDARDVTHYRPVPCSPCVHVAETPPCRGDNICMQKLYDPAASSNAVVLMATHRPRRVGS